MNLVEENIKYFRTVLPDSVKLIAVSKTVSQDKIMQAYNAGQRLFGENKVQELQQKQADLPHDIEWHFIGHLQTNKVKYIAPFISLIHSVDSLKLLSEINKEGQKCGRVIDCLFEMHIASEETKFGMDESEITAILESEDYCNMRNISVCGLMGMASFTSDYSVVDKEFKRLNSFFEILKKKYFGNNNNFKELSIGMSGDFEIAMKNGSTMVRIGSSVFGSR